jgi:hypothetical protein
VEVDEEREQEPRSHEIEPLVRDLDANHGKRGCAEIEYQACVGRRADGEQRIEAGGEHREPESARVTNGFVCPAEDFLGCRSGRQFGTGQRRSGKSRSVESRGTFECGAHEIRVHERCSVQTRASEGCIFAVAETQVTAAQVRSIEAGTSESSAREARFTEVGAAEVNAGEACAAKICPLEVRGRFDLRPLSVPARDVERGDDELQSAGRLGRCRGHRRRLYRGSARRSLRVEAAWAICLGFRHDVPMVSPRDCESQ